MARRLLRLGQALSYRLGTLRQHAPHSLNSLPISLTAELPQWPRLGIVTPSHNQGAFLKATMQSVLNAGYPNLEYVVMDGGSSDESVPVIEQQAERLAHWVSASDGGQAEALQDGCTQTTGPIMAWINADDVYLPGALHFAGAYMARHPHVDVIYSHRVIIDERGDEVGRWLMPPHDEQIIALGGLHPARDPLLAPRSVGAGGGAGRFLPVRHRLGSAATFPGGRRPLPPRAPVSGRVSRPRCPEDP